MLLTVRKCCVWVFSHEAEDLRLFFLSFRRFFLFCASVWSFTDITEFCRNFGNDTAGSAGRGFGSSSSANVIRTCHTRATSPPPPPDHSPRHGTAAGTREYAQRCVTLICVSEFWGWGRGISFPSHKLVMFRSVSPGRGSRLESVQTYKGGSSRSCHRSHSLKSLRCIVAQHT